MTLNKEKQFEVANEMKLYFSILRPPVLILLLTCLFKYGILSNLPVNWFEAMYNGKKYYYNSLTGVSQWELPMEVPIDKARADDLVLQQNKLRRKPFRLKPYAALASDNEASDKSVFSHVNQSLSLPVSNSSIAVSLQRVEAVVLFVRLLRLEELLKGEVQNRLILEENIERLEYEQRNRDRSLLSRQKKVQHASNLKVRKLKEKLQLLESQKLQLDKKSKNKKLVSQERRQPDNLQKKRNPFSFFPQLLFRRRSSTLANETVLIKPLETIDPTSSLSIDNLLLKAYLKLLICIQATNEDQFLSCQSKMLGIMCVVKERFVSFISVFCNQVIIIDAFLETSRWITLKLSSVI
jgi:hypothetical protein